MSHSAPEKVPHRFQVENRRTRTILLEGRVDGSGAIAVDAAKPEVDEELRRAILAAVLLDFRQGYSGSPLPMADLEWFEL